MTGEIGPRDPLVPGENPAETAGEGPGPQLPSGTPEEGPGGFNLSAWALGHRNLMVFFMGLFFIAGVYSYFSLGRSEDPTYTVRSMVVTVASWHRTQFCWTTFAPWDDSLIGSGTWPE